MIVDDVMTDKITLHGLGFVQVQLQGNQRLHVWHPELPRRACFEHSAIHDHRFNFTSRVIVGTQINHTFEDAANDAGEFVLYLHEGARTASGGRPWTPDGRADMVRTESYVIEAGNDYNTLAYEFHRTEPAGDGRVATIMAKRGEYPAGAHSTCRFGIMPDTDFDRFQWTTAKLWEVVADVLTGQPRPASPVARPAFEPFIFSDSPDGAAAEAVYLRQIAAHEVPGTSGQRLNQLANEGE